MPKCKGPVCIRPQGRVLASTRHVGDWLFCCALYHTRLALCSVCQYTRSALAVQVVDERAARRELGLTGFHAVLDDA